MSAAVVDLARALDFAARKHAKQRRKGETAEPYVNHLIEVVAILAEATAGRDPTLLLAGALHDAIEDVGATREEIAGLFGEDVAALVCEVTDDKSLPKQERKRLQVETAPKKSPRAKRLKLADKTSNLRDLTKSPPADWPPERRREYVRWAEQVAAGCRGVDARLDAVFDAALAEARAAFAA